MPLDWKEGSDTAHTTHTQTDSRTPHSTPIVRPVPPAVGVSGPVGARAPHHHREKRRGREGAPARAPILLFACLMNGVLVGYLIEICIPCIGRIDHRQLDTIDDARMIVVRWAMNYGNGQGTVCSTGAPGQDFSAQLGAQDKGLAIDNTPSKLLLFPPGAYQLLFEVAQFRGAKVKHCNALALALLVCLFAFLLSVRLARSAECLFVSDRLTVFPLIAMVMTCT